MTTLAPAPPPRSRPRNGPRSRPRGRRCAAQVDLLPAGRSLRAPRSGPGALRTAVFPVVLLVVLVGGGWYVGRAVVAAQPMTSTVSSPAASASWGRLVVLGATQYDRPSAGAADDVVVDVVVRLVRADGTGRFDPASVVLRRPDGAEVPATLGALAPVRVPADGSVEGRLGFVTAPFDGAPVLVVRDGPGVEEVVALRPSRHVGPAPDDAGAAWLPGR